jgi:tyrosine-protein phosphatase YwqE
VQQKAKEHNIPVNISLGNEIMFFSDLEEYYDKKVFLTMNGSR